MPKKKVKPIKYSAVDKLYSRHKCKLCGKDPGEEGLCQKCGCCPECCECGAKKAKQ